MAPTATCQKLSKVLEVGAPAPEANSVKMYDDNLARVRELLGPDFLVTMPATRDDTNEVFQASVDLSQIIANLRTVTQLMNLEPQIWEQAEEGNLRESLFPMTMDEPELGMRASYEAFVRLHRIRSQRDSPSSNDRTEEPDPRTEGATTAGRTLSTNNDEIYASR